MFFKKGVLNIFAKFTGKHLCQSFFFNKVAGLNLRPATLFKKRLWHRCFLVDFVKFLRTLFLQNTSGRLLLVFLKHNSLKLDIFFNPICAPCFSGSRFFRVHVFQGPGYSGYGFKVQVQVLEVAFFNKVLGWKPETVRSSHCRCSAKQGVLKNLANFTGVSF